MEDDRILLPCSCVSTCTIALVMDFTPYDPEIYFEFYTCHRPKRIRDKIKSAYDVITGRDNYIHSMVLESDQATMLRDFLAQHLNKVHAQTTGK